MNLSNPLPTRRSPAALLLVPLVFAIVLTLFVWPSARLEPRARRSRTATSTARSSSPRPARSC